MISVLERVTTQREWVSDVPGRTRGVASNWSRERRKLLDFEPDGALVLSSSYTESQHATRWSSERVEPRP